MITWKQLRNHYSIKVTNQEGFIRIIPCEFFFKKKAFSYVEKMSVIHPGYTYEVIDNLKGIKVKK